MKRARWGRGNAIDVAHSAAVDNVVGPDALIATGGGTVGSRSFDATTSGVVGI